MRKNIIDVAREKLESMPEDERNAMKAELRKKWAEVDEATRLKKLEAERAARIAVVDAYRAAGLELVRIMKSRTVHQLPAFLAAFKVSRQKVSARGLDPKMLAHPILDHIEAIDVDAFISEVEAAHAAALEVAKR